MKQHPDSEAIARWLAGERVPATGSHLRNCAECGAQVARLESAITRFRGAAHQWSGRQPLSHPPAGWAAEFIAGRRRFAGTRWPVPMRWAAAAAMAALLAALPLYRNYSQRQATAEAQANALLLEAVASDISRPAPQPLEPLIKLVSQSTTGDKR